MKFAIVFPGQGSQSAGMLAELAVQNDLVLQTFQQASAVLGYDLWALVTDNPQGKLNQTEFTQPAMLTAGVAVWRVWQSRNLGAPALLAGHSLGEYTALVAAGVLEFEDAVQAVAERGRLMQAAVPAGEGAMAVVLGLDDDAVRALCADVAGNEVLEAVNFNSPGQVVIAGHSAAIERAIEKAPEYNARKAMLLPVSVPSHSSLMKDAAESLYQYFSDIQFNAPSVPVLQNVDADTHMEPQAIMDALTQQLFSPVLWVNTVNAMKQQGIEAVFELGPGKVLSGLNKRIEKQLQAVPVDTPAGMDKAAALLND